MEISADPENQEPPTPKQLLEAASTHEKLRALVNRSNADINTRNVYGKSALHLAVDANIESSVEILLDCGIDIEACDRQDRRPLTVAVQQKHYGIIRILLMRKAVANTLSRGLTPLHEATIHGDVEIMQLLLDHGADHETPSSEDKQPLYYAVELGNVEAVKLLLANKANPSTFSSHLNPPSCLHLSAANGDTEITSCLLEAGAYVDMRDSFSATPIFGAVAAGSIECVKLLLGRGADTNIWRSSDLQSVSDLAKGNPEMLRLLQSKPDRVFQGPRIRGPGFEEGKTSHHTKLRPSPWPSSSDHDKLVACHGFQALITDFFTEGDHEKYVPKTASVYDLLYRYGPSYIRSRTGGLKPDFTWYHLPANNVSSMVYFSKKRY